MVQINDLYQIKKQYFKIACFNYYYTILHSSFPFRR